MRVINVILILSVAIVLFIAAVPQIGNGGFEMVAAPPNATIPGWSTVTAQNAQILTNPTGDVNMPVEGQGWLTFSGAGSSNAMKPSVIGGFGNPPTNVVSVAETFTLSGSNTRLEIDVVFLSNESPGTIWEDFLSVDLSDGTNSYNLICLDTNSPTPQTSSLYNQTISQTGMKTTAVTRATVDIPAVFASADTNTTFTITLSVGNAIDASLPSRAYFDNLKFTAGTPINQGVVPANIRIDPMANGDWLFVCEAPAWPGGIIHNVFSGNTSLPAGMGPFAGLVPDQSTYFTMNAPLGVPPFHVGLDGNGRYQFVIPAWAAPGIEADCFMAVFYAGILVEISPVVRHTY